MNWLILSIGDNEYYGGERNNEIRIVKDKRQAKRFYNESRASLQQIVLRSIYPSISIQLVMCKETEPIYS